MPLPIMSRAGLLMMCRKILQIPGRGIFLPESRFGYKKLINIWKYMLAPCVLENR
jgi:hypothetical protein